MGENLPFEQNVYSLNLLTNTLYDNNCWHIGNPPKRRPAKMDNSKVIISMCKSLIQHCHLAIITPTSHPRIHLSPYSTKKRVGVGSSLRHLTHEMYMPNAKTRRHAPNATYIPLEYRLRLLPNTKKSTQKNRNVHGRRKKLASPNAKDTNMLVSLR